MLSRVADSLYWMSRYVERAENIARLVDVNLQLMLDIPAHQAARLEKNWLPVVACLGDDAVFLQRYGKGDLPSVLEFLVFDREHQNSLVGSLSAARENARTIREHLTTEMWEQINRTYLWCTSKSARQAFERNQYEFFQRVIQALQTFAGITESTMLQAEAWDFMQVGKCLERADKTTRVLDDQFHLLRQCGDTPNDHLLQWLAVLRSVSGRLTYQRLHGVGVNPMKVAELLLLNTDFPRSVEFCVFHLDQALRRLSGVAPGRFSNRAEQLSGRLLSELCFSRIEEIYGRGLHRVMDELQSRFNEIGFAIFQIYIDQPLPPAELPLEVQAVPQQ